MFGWDVGDDKAQAPTLGAVRPTTGSLIYRREGRLYAPGNVIPDAVAIIA
jgi:hypothetical protein